MQCFTYCFRPIYPWKPRKGQTDGGKAGGRCTDAAGNIIPCAGRGSGRDDGVYRYDYDDIEELERRIPVRENVANEIIRVGRRFSKIEAESLGKEFLETDYLQAESVEEVSL